MWLLYWPQGAKIKFCTPQNLYDGEEDGDGGV